MFLKTVELLDVVYKGDTNILKLLLVLKTMCPEKTIYSDDPYFNVLWKLTNVRLYSNSLQRIQQMKLD